MNSKSRILIVEDDMDLALNLAELFEVWGYEVRTAFDGPSALMLARRYRPDVVILDLALPGMNGFVVARTLCEQPEYKHPFLIAISGYENDSYFRTALHSGIHHYFIKPPDIDGLRTLIEDQLSTSVSS